MGHFEHFKNAKMAYEYYRHFTESADEFRKSGDKRLEVNSIRNTVQDGMYAHKELMQHIMQVIDPLTEKPVEPGLASIIASHTLHDADEMGFEESYDHNFEWFTEHEGLPIEAESRLLKGDESGYKYLAAYLKRKDYPLSDRLRISRSIMGKIRETGNLLEAIRQLSGKQD